MGYSSFELTVQEWWLKVLVTIQSKTQYYNINKHRFLHLKPLYLYLIQDVYQILSTLSSNSWCTLLLDFGCFLFWNSLCLKKKKQQIIVCCICFKKLNGTDVLEKMTPDQDIPHHLRNCETGRFITTLTTAGQLNSAHTFTFYIQSALILTSQPTVSFSKCYFTIIIFLTWYSNSRHQLWFWTGKLRPNVFLKWYWRICKVNTIVTQLQTIQSSVATLQTREC